MLLCEILDTGVPAARRTDSVRSIVIKLISRDCGMIPVVDDDETLVGVISIRDVMIPLFPNYPDYIHDNVNGRDFELMEDGYSKVLEMTAADIMTPNPMTAALYDPILKTASYMGMKNLRRIPVVDDNKYVGIVGITDVNKALFFHKGFASVGYKMPS